MTVNQREHVRACLSSVLAAFRQVRGMTEIVVVDNGSDDGSIEMIREKFPMVRLLEQGRNTGFPPAAAEGIRHTTAEWILLLNNDATIAEDGVAELLAAGTTAEDVGSVAAKVIFADGSGLLNSAGFGVDRLGIAYERYLGEPSERCEERQAEVFGASGGGALLRRQMLNDTGGIDESFFLYLEDVDLAWRARAKGWRCIFAPKAVVHHHHSATTRHGSDLKYFHVGLNRVRVLAKNAPTRHLLLYGPAIVAYDLAYISFVAVRDRSFAPLRGRMHGLRQWKRYRRMPRTRDSLVLEPVRGLRAALQRYGVWRRNSAASAQGGPVVCAMSHPHEPGASLLGSAVADGGIPAVNARGGLRQGVRGSSRESPTDTATI